MIRVLLASLVVFGVCLLLGADMHKVGLILLICAPMSWYGGKCQEETDAASDLEFVRHNRFRSPW